MPLRKRIQISVPGKEERDTDVTVLGKKLHVQSQMEKELKICETVIKTNVRETKGKVRINYMHR